MATFPRVRSKSSSMNVNGYTIHFQINSGHILGKGAYGVVYKAVDAKKNTVAAKAVDGKEHSKVMTQDYKPLAKLKHENIVRILDISKQDDTLWMMMEYCEYGDLNHFYLKNFPKTSSEELDIMIGLAKGVEYLHSKNIIHRDIKPGNILISSINPLVAKLTDFDLCKSLNPDFETSQMSSNVGTNAFKAPEFFKRIDGKLKYHRNVDIFALGLTYLAMLQAEKGCSKLVPRIETPRDDSDLHEPIGRLLATRMKYKEPGLNVIDVTVGGPANPIAGTFLGTVPAVFRARFLYYVKPMIRKMTLYKPNERPAARNVVDDLLFVKASAETRNRFTAQACPSNVLEAYPTQSLLNTQTARLSRRGKNSSIPSVDLQIPMYNRRRTIERDGPVVIQRVVTRNRLPPSQPKRQDTYREKKDRPLPPAPNAGSPLQNYSATHTKLNHPVRQAQLSFASTVLEKKKLANSYSSLGTHAKISLSNLAEREQNLRDLQLESVYKQLQEEIVHTTTGKTVPEKKKLTNSDFSLGTHAKISLSNLAEREQNLRDLQVESAYRQLREEIVHTTKKNPIYQWQIQNSPWEVGGVDPCK